MNYNGCECNGIWGAWTKFPAEFKAAVKREIPALRETARTLIESPEWQHRASWHYGSRFNDDETILARALSGLGHVAPEFAYEHFTAGKIRDYIIAAYLDAASADHWYTFEKDWD